MIFTLGVVVKYHFLSLLVPFSFSFIWQISIHIGCFVVEKLLVRNILSLLNLILEFLSLVLRILAIHLLLEVIQLVLNIKVSLFLSDGFCLVHALISHQTGFIFVIHRVVILDDLLAL